jgi:Dyp-type peroxidase family
MSLLEAAEIIESEKEANACLIDLARHLSLAVHIETELLRAMRLTVMPEAEAGIEADLWFSSLVQARDVGGLVFLPEVRTLLQLELAKHPAELEVAKRVIEAKHCDLDAVVLLEERAVYYALKGDRQSLWEMQRQLGAVVQTLNQPQEDPGLLRWVARTLPRLPDRAKASEAAIVLRYQTAQRLGTFTVAGIPEVTTGQWPSDFVSPQQFTRIGCKMFPGGMRLSYPPEPNAQLLEMPETSPVRVEVGWPVPTGWETRFVDLESGATPVFVAAPVGLFRIRSVQGDEVRLRPAVQGIFRPLLSVLVAQEDAAVTDVLRTELEDLGWSLEVVRLHMDERPKIFLSYMPRDLRRAEILDQVVTSLRADGFEFVEYRQGLEAERQQQRSQLSVTANGAVLFLTPAALRFPSLLEEATELLSRAQARKEFRLVAVISETSALEALYSSPLRDTLLLASGVQIILPDTLENQVAQVRQAFAELRQRQDSRPWTEDVMACLLSLDDREQFEHFIEQLRSTGSFASDSHLDYAIAQHIPLLVRIANRLEPLAPIIAPGGREPNAASASGMRAMHLAEGLASLRARFFGRYAEPIPEPGRELRREVLAVEAGVLRRWISGLLSLPRALADRATPIAHADLPQLVPWLDNLQGDILRGHGRDHTVHVFLRFVTEPERVKQWIRRIAMQVTSAQQQLEEAEVYRRDSIPGGLFMNVTLSAAGYRFLGLDLVGHSRAFVEGMKRARERLNDPSVDTWETGYQGTIHAMILLADDDETRLLEAQNEIRRDLETYAEICAVEHGRALRNERGEPVEHFGYAIGRSQPLFFQKDVEQEQQMDGIDRWDPSAGPGLVIVKDPHGGDHGCGSYLVFRKLEQNVRGFHERARALAQALGLSEEAVDSAEALAIGRFKDGTPLVLSASPGLRDPAPNNFTYINDPHGQKCPFHAHIRKVNPRQPGAPLIARRGITYGKRDKEPQDNPSFEELPVDGVGLLFMCYQRDIAEQFEFLQIQGTNHEDFSQVMSNIDPIIGQTKGHEPLPQQWPRQWQAQPQAGESFSFHGFVTLKGGEYFFAPSIYFLRNL